MPRGDGTGPMGLGPMTGRAAGCCAGFATPGFANPVSDYCGLGRGGGRGRRRRYQAAGIPGWGCYAGALTSEDPNLKRLAAQREESLLTRQIETMEQTLQNAKDRLAELTQNQE